MSELQAVEALRVRKVVGRPDPCVADVESGVLLLEDCNSDCWGYFDDCVVESLRPVAACIAQFGVRWVLDSDGGVLSREDLDELLLVDLDWDSLEDDQRPKSSGCLRCDVWNLGKFANNGVPLLFRLKLNPGFVI